jgi:DNA-directed RNA polymerase specialized sigma24 family protein
MPLFKQNPDLVQEVFIRAFSGRVRECFDGIRDFRPYLNTIARNCFLDTVRKHGREVLVPPGSSSLDSGAVAIEHEFDAKVMTYSNST